MSKRRGHRRRGDDARMHRRVLRLSLFLILVAVSFCWYHGYIGALLRSQMNQWFLPRTMFSDRLLLQPLRVSSRAYDRPLVQGIQLTVSSRWIRDVAKGSPFPAFLIPPGLFIDGLNGEGALRFPQEDGSLYPVPLFVHVRDTVSLVPDVTIRFSANQLNHLLDEAFAEDWTEKGEYLLGSFNLEQSIRVDHLRIDSVSPDAESPMYPIVLRAMATGRLRYRFEDGWFRARLTARVKELSVRFVLIPIAHPDGIGFDYQAKIDKVELQVNRMAPWLERRLAKSVRESLERSLNKKRKRERMARNRWPLWLPMALSVDIEIINPIPDAED